jgi:hypothetical protein
MTRRASARFATLVAGLALCADLAWAQAPDSDKEFIERPEWSVGDWWELMEGDGPARRLTVITREKDQYVLVRTGAGTPGRDSPTAAKLYADLDGWVTKVAWPDGRVKDMGDKHDWMKFPAAVGKRWSFFAETSTVQGGRAHFAFECKAEAWETIEVGHRQVRALKVACQSRNRATGRTNTHRSCMRLK